jgi:predicted nucleic acid-binding protein
MIVADANLISFLVLRGENMATASAVYVKDRDWIAPPLWRSEVRNVLCTYLRSGRVSLEQAIAAFKKAAELVADYDGHMPEDEVFALAVASGCSGYDCEYAWLAQRLHVPLVTGDRKLLAALPHRRIPCRFRRYVDMAGRHVASAREIATRPVSPRRFVSSHAGLSNSHLLPPHRRGSISSAMAAW